MNEPDSKNVSYIDSFHYFRNVELTFIYDPKTFSSFIVFCFIYLSAGEGENSLFSFGNCKVIRECFQ